jgi:hypothetical protein
MADDDEEFPDSPTIIEVETDVGDVTPVVEQQGEQARSVEDLRRHYEHVGWKNCQRRMIDALVEIGAETGATYDEMDHLIRKLLRMTVDRRNR